MEKQQAPLNIQKKNIVQCLMPLIRQFEFQGTRMEGKAAEATGLACTTVTGYSHALSTHCMSMVGPGALGLVSLTLPHSWYILHNKALLR